MTADGAGPNSRRLKKSLKILEAGILARLLPKTCLVVGRSRLIPAREQLGRDNETVTDQ